MVQLLVKSDKKVYQDVTFMKLVRAAEEIQHIYNIYRKLSKELKEDISVDLIVNERLVKGYRFYNSVKGEQL